MSESFWKSPANGLSLSGVDKIVVYRVIGCKIVSEEGWPEKFWSNVKELKELTENETKDFLAVFKKIPEGEPARCHMPPWGFAAYCGSELLFTTTVCFECDNVYVFTNEGRELRAFDTLNPPSAQSLFNTFSSMLPLDENT